jgi:Domain of unknown function (DUF4440)
LGDPREVWNKKTVPLSLSFYSSFIKNKELEILVTDFPMEVNTMMANASNLKKLMHDIHHKKFKWLATSQFDSLSTLLHDDVYYIHSNGWQESKSEVLENIKSGKLTYHDVKVHASEVRLVDNTGIVTGKGTFYVSLNGKPNEYNLFYTEVYVKTDQGIKLLSRHACKY